MSNRKSKQRRRKRAAQRRRRRVRQHERATQFIKTIEKLCKDALAARVWSSTSDWPLPVQEMANAITALGLQLHECTPNVLTAVFAARDEFPELKRSEYPHWVRTLMNKVKLVWKYSPAETGRMSFQSIPMQQIPRPPRRDGSGHAFRTTLAKKIKE